MICVFSKQLQIRKGKQTLSYHSRDGKCSAMAEDEGEENQAKLHRPENQERKPGETRAILGENTVSPRNGPLGRGEEAGPGRPPSHCPPPTRAEAWP